jgi:hypothetical protein
LPGSLIGTAGLSHGSGALPGPVTQNVDLSVNYNNSTLGVDPAEQRRQDGIRQDRGIAKVAPIDPGHHCCVYNYHSLCN